MIRIAALNSRNHTYFDHAIISWQGMGIHFLPICGTLEVLRIIQCGNSHERLQQPYSIYFAPMQLYLDDKIPPRHESFLRRTVTGFARPRPAAAVSGPVSFIDDGFGPANNPSEEAFREVKDSNERIGTLVSIGKGRGSADKFHTRLMPFIKAGIAAVGDPQPAHIAMLGA